MRVKKLLLLALSLMMTFSLAVNCGGKKEETADAPANPGKDLYDQNCASCHGETGAGDGPAGASLNPKPRNYKAPAADWKNGADLAGVTKTLKEGIPGTGMVAYGHLGDDNLKLIAEYVLTLK